MEWLAFAGSVIGGLIGGLFTFIGVRMTIKHEDKKKERERLEKANLEKPRLEIIKYRDFKETHNLKSASNDWNVLVLGIQKFEEKDGRALFYYDDLALDLKNLEFVEYELVNSGLTEIEDMCATCNLPKNVAFFELENRESHIVNHFLSYEAWANRRYIKPKQTVKLRVYYIKDQRIVSNLGSAVVTLWLRDVNGFLWSQSLFAPGQELDISRMSNRAEFKDSRDIEAAIRCFNGTLPW